MKMHGTNNVNPRTAIRSTRDAVETAIDLAKTSKSVPWGAVIESYRQIARWGPPQSAARGEHEEKHEEGRPEEG